MKNPDPSIRINVDPTNPGQFFACCGLLELADRLWPGAEGWFEKGEFCVACEGTLEKVLAAAKAVTIAGMGGETDADDEQEDDDDDENASRARSDSWSSVSSPPPVAKAGRSCRTTSTGVCVADVPSWTRAGFCMPVAWAP